MAGTALPTAMFFGSIVATLCELRKFNAIQWMKVWQDGLLQGVGPMVNIGVKAGLGGVVAATPCYAALIANIANIDINPYALVFIACAILAGFLGSATSAEAIVLPQLLPIFKNFVDKGANMGYLHRLSAMGAITLDSLPHNGSIIACCEMFNTTQKQSYWPVFITCTVIPLIVGFLTVPLCAIF
jgi:H+/gluconate symporter-like permease